MTQILEKKEYKAGIKIQDFSSTGRVSRILGRKTGRIHHFLSDLETNVFYILDFDKNVIDIKEHYPLEDIRDIVADSDIDWSKFKNKKTNKEYTITSTFLVRLSNNKEVAISCKNQSELYKSNTQLKLEIERRYWNYKKIEWIIITNKDIPKIKLKNIKWLLLGAGNDINAELTNIIKETINKNTGKLKEYINWISQIYNYEEKVVLSTLKAMILNYNLIIDLDEEITVESNIERFKVKGVV